MHFSVFLHHSFGFFDIFLEGGSQDPPGSAPGAQSAQYAFVRRIIYQKWFLLKYFSTFMVTRNSASKLCLPTKGRNDMRLSREAMLEKFHFRILSFSYSCWGTRKFNNSVFSAPSSHCTANLMMMHLPIMTR